MSWKQSFVLIGHRGASAYEPENTIRSFMKAIEMGVDAVEMDVRLTKDGIPIVIHDEDLKRVCGVDAKVRDLTLEEVKKYKVFGSEPIPTLEEALNAIDSRVGVLIELKEVGIESKVLEIVDKLGLKENVLIISFYLEALEKVRQLDSSIDVGFITARTPIPIRELEKLKVFAVLPKFSIVTPMLVKELHAKRFRIYVWTVNDVATAIRMINYGVDGIATDKPDIRFSIAKQVNLLKYGKM